MPAQTVPSYSDFSFASRKRSSHSHTPPCPPAPCALPISPVHRSTAYVWKAAPEELHTAAAMHSITPHKNKGGTGSTSTQTRVDPFCPLREANEPRANTNNSIAKNKQDHPSRVILPPVSGGDHPVPAAARALVVAQAPPVGEGGGARGGAVAAMQRVHHNKVEAAPLIKTRRARVAAGRLRKPAHGLENPKYTPICPDLGRTRPLPWHRRTVGMDTAGVVGEGVPCRMAGHCVIWRFWPGLQERCTRRRGRAREKKTTMITMGIQEIEDDGKNRHLVW